MKSRPIQSPRPPRSSAMWFLFCFVLTLMAGHQRVLAAASAVLSPVPGWNGLSCEATVKVGFREVGGARREDFRTSSQNLLITPGIHAAGDVLTMAPASAVLLPTTGAVKDKASGSFGMSYVVGSLSEPDTFRLLISTGTSAMTAHHSFAGGAPVPVNAFVTGRIAIRTFEPLTDRTLRLPALPALVSPATETMSASFFGRGGGPTPSGFILPGHDGVDVPMSLASGQYFEYFLDYEIVTPFGSDPDISYTLTGSASALVAPVPDNTPLVESIRREMPTVTLNKLFYADAESMTATVRFVSAADAAAHQKLIFVSPKTDDIEGRALVATADPLVFTVAPLIMKNAGSPNKFDNTLIVPAGEMFTAVYGYNLSKRILPDQSLKSGTAFLGMDYGIARNPAFSKVKVKVLPKLAMGGMNEENPPGGGRKLGTIAEEGKPGIVQIASEDLIYAPRSARHAAEFAALVHATPISSDTAWKTGNSQTVFYRYQTIDNPAFNAEREARIEYLPQMLSLTGMSGNFYASNTRTLALFATALELWLEGYAVAVNPRVTPNGRLQAPEGRGFQFIFPGTDLTADPFDSMTSPDGGNEFRGWKLDDPRQGLRDMWAEAAMQDSDAQEIKIAFIDSSFAPNPDFRGFPDRIPQFNLETGLRGPHVAERPEQPIPIRGPVWHGNGTVAVAGGVMGNGYGFAGVAGQIMQPMLYYMGTLDFAFEMGQAMELAVADGADIINISASYPCRILTVLGPIRHCSESDRAAIIGTLGSLIAASSATICASAPFIDGFLPGLGGFLCGSSVAAATTAITALVDALALSSAIGDPRQPMERGVATAKAAGVPVVGSAGNQGANWSFLGDFQGLFDTTNCRADDWENVPAVIPDVICTSETWPTTPYANKQFHGPAVDLWAPGGQLVMMPSNFTLPDPSVVPPNEQRVLDFGGSSASAPFVSGVIAHMMAINPSMDPHRNTPAQRTTAVDRITAMLRATANAPGSPGVPDTLPDDNIFALEVSRRGLLVNALAARTAARIDAGVPALSDGGFPADQARLDPGFDDLPIRSLSLPLAPGTELPSGGLPFRDLDIWSFQIPQSTDGQFRQSVLTISIPATESRVPALLSDTTPLPYVGTSGGMHHFEAIVRCVWRENLLRLSCVNRAGAPGPLNRVDTMYKITPGPITATPAPDPDRFDAAAPNDFFYEPTVLPGTDWQPITGPAAALCTGFDLTIPNVTLSPRSRTSNCRDIDHYLIPAWPGYDPEDPQSATLSASLSPDVPGAEVEFMEISPLGFEVGAIVIPNSTGLVGSSASINANTHALPLMLRVKGGSAGAFNVNIRYCVRNTAFDNLLHLARDFRGRFLPAPRPGGDDFVEFFREGRTRPLNAPMHFGTAQTRQLKTFKWPTDKEGRSYVGQLFMIDNAAFGDIKLQGDPASGGASIRFDLFSLDGTHLGTAGTEDLADGNGGTFFGGGKPVELAVTKAPAGEYLLAVSGFRFGDAWDFTLGENQTRPGFASLDGKGKPAPMELREDTNPEVLPAAWSLVGQNFDFYTVPAVQLDFNIGAEVPWRLEYSEDGENWFEGGCAQKSEIGGLISTVATPPWARLLLPSPGQGPLPGYDTSPKPGFVRIRNLSKHTIIPAVSSPAYVFAVPTEEGVNYQFNTSDDLNNWKGDPPIPGDGSVFQWQLPAKDKPRGFSRVDRK